MKWGVTMPKGIFRNAAQTDKDKVVDTSYQSETLAQMIPYAWGDQNFKNQLTTGADAARSNKAKQALADRGIYLQHPIVITEAEYDNGYNMPNPDGVVFVLPNQPRTAAPPTGQTLLETAKLLMACIPNGI